MRDFVRPANWPFLVKVALAPLVALVATILVAVIGANGLATGSRAVDAGLVSASSTQELEQIAAGVQGINGNLYHILTQQAAHTKGLQAAAQLHALLADATHVAELLRNWRDTRATPAQRTCPPRSARNSC